jgi:hypothetical protein
MIMSHRTVGDMTHISTQVTRVCVIKSRTVLLVESGLVVVEEC